jgi:hypothetical protein
MALRLLLLFPLLSSVAGLRRSDFPPSFLFGAGTSSYQVRAVRAAADAELSMLTLTHARM